MYCYLFYQKYNVIDVMQLWIDNLEFNNKKKKKNHTIKEKELIKRDYKIGLDMSYIGCREYPYFIVKTRF